MDADKVPSTYILISTPGFGSWIRGRELTSATENPEEFFEFNFGYDVIHDAKLALQKELPGWEVPENFFESEPGRGTYP